MGMLPNLVVVTSICEIINVFTLPIINTNNLITAETHPPTWPRDVSHDIHMSVSIEPGTGPTQTPCLTTVTVSPVLSLEATLSPIISREATLTPVLPISTSSVTSPYSTFNDFFIPSAKTPTLMCNDIYSPNFMHSSDLETSSLTPASLPTIPNRGFNSFDSNIQFVVPKSSTIESFPRIPLLPFSIEASFTPRTLPISSETSQPKPIVNTEASMTFIPQRNLQCENALTKNPGLQSEVSNPINFLDTAAIGSVNEKLPLMYIPQAFQRNIPNVDHVSTPANKRQGSVNKVTFIRSKEPGISLDKLPQFPAKCDNKFFKDNLPPVQSPTYAKVESLPSDTILQFTSDVSPLYVNSVQQKLFSENVNPVIKIAQLPTSIITEDNVNSDLSVSVSQIPSLDRYTFPQYVISPASETTNDHITSDIFPPIIPLNPSASLSHFETSAVVPTYTPIPLNIQENKLFLDILNQTSLDKVRVSKQSQEKNVDGGTDRIILDTVQTPLLLSSDTNKAMLSSNSHLLPDNIVMQDQFNNKATETNHVLVENPEIRTNSNLDVTYLHQNTILSDINNKIGIDEMGSRVDTKNNVFSAQTSSVEFNIQNVDKKEQINNIIPITGQSFSPINNNDANTPVTSTFQTVTQNPIANGNDTKYIPELKTQSIPNSETTKMHSSTFLFDSLNANEISDKITYIHPRDIKTINANINLISQDNYVLNNSTSCCAQESEVSISSHSLTAIERPSKVFSEKSNTNSQSFNPIHLNALNSLPSFNLSSPIIETPSFLCNPLVSGYSIAPTRNLCSSPFVSTLGAASSELTMLPPSSCSLPSSSRRPLSSASDVTSDLSISSSLSSSSCSLPIASIIINIIPQPDFAPSEIIIII